ncbi:sulfide/dihydroorotate dehydrogenase-like FAD/NAD-binding protein [[Eubacterium] cellulosolvens]
MNKIINKKELAPNVKLIEVEAPLIAKKQMPGQFVVLRVCPEGERIPLTIADSNRAEGSITLIFQEVGKTTRHLGTLNVGDVITDLAGPFGTPSDIRCYGTVVVVGGGAATAVAYPEARALKKAGNIVVTIIGARTKNLLILEDEMKAISDEIYVATDDGSQGYHGFVTDVLRQIIEEKREIDLVIAIGPVLMMKAVAEVTRPHKIKTIASLNPIMIDATGMCGGCRVSVGGKTKFACIDGPEFDAHQVDFDLLLARQRTYLDMERMALDRWEKECKLK